MNLPIQLICTDFDGTIFAEFEKPPIAEQLVNLIGELQSRGAKWVINTGRDMSSLMESLGRSRIPIQPDALVLVEREIHFHRDSRFIGHEEWNRRCVRLHEELFIRVRADLPRLTGWIAERFDDAMVYQDPYSPFCLLARNNGDADVIHEYLETYAREVPHLTVVRNDVYARFSHAEFNKGTALAEISRRFNVRPEHIFVAGDHLNDIPMLTQAHARWLVSPSNGIDPVKELIRRQNGFISEYQCGHGVVDGLVECLRQCAPREFVAASR